jgi:hypothetical protein
MNYEWWQFDLKKSRNLSFDELSEIMRNNEHFIVQEEARAGTLFVQPFRLKIVALDREITRRIREKIKEKNMSKDSLQLVPPVINQTAEKADTTKEKSMSTTQRQSKPRTSPEVIAEIQKLRSGTTPMSLSGIAEKLEISFETAKKYDPLQTKQPAKPARAGSPKVQPKKATPVKKPVQKVAPKKVAKVQKKVEVKKNPSAPKKVAAPKKKQAQATSNKSKITMLASEIRGKLTLLNALVMKEIG